MARKMLAVMGDGSIAFAANALTHTEYEKLFELRKKVIKGLEAIAANRMPAEDLADFKEQYNELKTHIEKMQVMQMGIALGEALLGGFFARDCGIRVRKGIIVETMKRVDLEAAIDFRFGPDHFAKEDMIDLLVGMLEIEINGAIHRRKGHGRIRKSR